MDKLDAYPVDRSPAAGKSEDRIFETASGRETATGLPHRPFEELDDFLYVWRVFEDDNIREHMGLPRRDTDTGLYFLDDRIWDYFIERIDLDFRKKLARDPSFLEHHTVLMEFARGGENGFTNAFQHLSDDVLARAAILYIDVSFEESLRKNRRRYRPEQADSILYHSLEDAKMERYYKDNDWARLSEGRDDGFIAVKGRQVPFAVFHNEPEKTLNPELLGAALSDVTGRLVKPFIHKG